MFCGMGSDAGVVTDAWVKLNAPAWAALKTRPGAIPRTRVARVAKPSAVPKARPILGAAACGVPVAGGWATVTASLR